MMSLRNAAGLLAVGIMMLAATPAQATFHFMQIEQVIGGVGGNTAAQAIQLRMRTGSQNFVSQGRIRAFDAAGANPVVIINFTSDVPNGALGDRVLVTTAAFNSLTIPVCVPNFTMTNPIPPSYLAAGSLTFESDTGIIYWRLSWGGAGYTGSNAGSATNDANGDFGPPFGAALPTAGVSALRFNGTASALSTTNLADYSITAGAAVVTNNARNSFTVTLGACCPAAGGCTEFQTAAACAAAGGVYQGNNTTCASAPCTPTTGACCLPNGSCLADQTAGTCDAAGGAFEGAGSLCGSVNCPVTTGACCAHNGTCAELTEAECMTSGGQFEGLASVCTPNPCPVVPVGACCTGDGNCHVDPADDCVLHGGFYFGDGTDCVTSTCRCLVGDTNCDGFVNNFDIDPFVFALLSAESPTPPADYALLVADAAECWAQRVCWADLNCDGAFNNFDIDPFVGCLVASPPPGQPCECAP
ncbi:MAG: hypothetical protein IPM64_07130 [Phycisphaerales bacterium]|nr:hypothetical protein [Phycisphaerales bacterium]